MRPPELVAFTVVADLGSLTRAAAATGAVPSLVSRQIARLETAWGDRLFERTGRGMALTDFGRRMLPEANLALEQLDRLGDVARESAGALTGTVHIGVLPSMSRQLLPLLIADLRSTAPAVRLNVTEGFSGHLDEQLTSGRLDMMVVNRYGPSGLGGEEILGTVDTCLVGRPDDPLLSGGSVAFRDIGNRPLVLPSRPNGLRLALDQISRRHGLDLNVVMEVDTGNAMKDIALSGEALTLLPRLAVVDEVVAGRLRAVKVVRPAIPRTIALSLATHRPMSKTARFVAGRLRQLSASVLCC